MRRLFDYEITILRFLNDKGEADSNILWRKGRYRGPQRFLNLLIELGYIEKEDNRYKITEDGRRVVAGLEE